MNLPRAVVQVVLAYCLAFAGPWALRAQTADQYRPQVGQAGKDAVWVPTPPSLVEKMLDMAQVTPQDFVVDLGSGDGRSVIAAARRGARARGIEYNAEMVALSRRNAVREGVSDKATFVEGDMFEADISQATVLALFLLSENLETLRPKFLELKPGTRIVANTFGVPGWTPDERETIQGDCTSWCTALLFIVPARVEGTWRLAQGELALRQDFQMVAGTLSSGGRSTPVENGRLRGDLISFTAGGAQYSGRVSGDAMTGTVKSGDAVDDWNAARIPR